MAKGDMERVPLFTNAPPHWPEQHLIGAELRTGRIAEPIAKGIVKGLRRQGIRDVEAESSARWLVDEGAVTSSFAILEGAKATAVYVFTDDLEGAASKFAWATNALTAHGHPSPVYYSTAALAQRDPVAPTLSFERTALAPASGRSLKKGGYSMWWGGPDPPNPETEAGLAYLHRAYVAMNGIEPLMAARVTGTPITKAAGAPGATLPDHEQLRPVSLPDLRYGLLAVSREKGIRFAFHVEDTPAAYRDLFLRHFADFAEQVRGEHRGNGLSPAATSPQDALRWWIGMESAFEAGVLGTESTDLNSHRIGNFDW